jgi:hypothetical protein
VRCISSALSFGKLGVSKSHWDICWYKPISCCPPFNYIGGPKGRSNILHNRTFYFGQPPYFFFFFFLEWWANQIGLLPPRERDQKKNLDKHLIKLIGEVYSEYMWNSSYFSLIRHPKSPASNPHSYTKPTFKITTWNGKCPTKSKLGILVGVQDSHTHIQ